MFNKLYKKAQDILKQYPENELMIDRIKARYGGANNRWPVFEAALTKLGSSALLDEERFNIAADVYIKLYKEFIKDGFHYMEAYKTKNKEMQKSFQQEIDKYKNLTIPRFEREIKDYELEIEQTKKHIRTAEEAIKSFAKGIKEFQEDIKIIESDPAILKDNEIMFKKLKHPLNL